jgi:ankyrin repeat protein
MTSNVKYKQPQTVWRNRLLLFGMERFSFPMMKLALLLGANPNIDVNFVDRKGYHLVTRCARSGRADLLDLLLKYGGDKHAPSSAWDSIQPIHMAASKGHVEYVKVLSAHGVSLNTPCWYGTKEMTPLTIAESQGHDVLADWLRSVSGEQNLPHMAKT